MNSNLFNMEFVSSIFQVNLGGDKRFVTAGDGSLCKRRVSVKEFTLLVIFSALSQQRSRYSWSYLVYVYKLYCAFIMMTYEWASVSKALNST